MAIVLIEPVFVYQVWLSRDLLSEFDVFERQWWREVEEEPIQLNEK